VAECSVTELEQDISQLIESMWHQDPTCRPSAGNVARELDRIICTFYPVDFDNSGDHPPPRCALLCRRDN